MSLLLTRIAAKLKLPILELIRSSTFYRGAVGVFGVKVASVVLAFALHLLLARELGIRNYGYYVYALTVVSLLSLIGILGLNSSLVKLIATYKSRSEWSLLKGVLRFSIFTASSSLMFVVLVLLILVASFGDRIAPEAKAVALPAIFLLPVFAYLRLTTAALRALEFATSAQVAELLIRHLALICLVFLVVVTRSEELKADVVLWLNVIATVLALGLAVRWLKKSWPKMPLDISPKMLGAEWTSISLSLLLLAGIQSLFRETDILMLGVLVGPDSVGAYGAAGKLADFVRFGLISANAVVAPMIASLYAAGQSIDLQNLLARSAKWSTVIAITVSIPLILGAAPLLNMFGTGFQAGRIPLQILVVGSVFSAVAGSAGVLLTMTGNHKQAGHILFVFVMANALLNAGLIPFFGAAGAAAATVVSKIGLKSAFIVYAIRKIGLNPTFFSRSRR